MSYVGVAILSFGTSMLYCICKYTYTLMRLISWTYVSWLPLRFVREDCASSLGTMKRTSFGVLSALDRFPCCQERFDCGRGGEAEDAAGDAAASGSSLAKSSSSDSSSVSTSSSSSSSS